VKIKRIYRRIDDKLKEERGNVIDEILAAEELDRMSERKGMNMNAHAIWLTIAFGGKYSTKHRRLT
jgi:hypothetical protein